MLPLFVFGKLEIALRDWRIAGINRSPASLADLRREHVVPSASLLVDGQTIEQLVGEASLHQQQVIF